jgi:hypothetical protein
MKLSGNAGVYIFLQAIALFTIVWSLFAIDYRIESKTLPVLVGSLVLLLATVGLWNEVRARKENEAAANEGSVTIRETWRGYAVHFGWLAGFLLAIYVIGYLLAIPIFVFSYTRRLGGGFLMAVISTVAVSAFIYTAFEFALDVKLYRGLLFS